MNALKTKVEDLEAQIESLQNQLKIQRRLLQVQCVHPDICECEYKPSSYGSTPPMRICMECGVTEDGWSFYALAGPNQRIAKISRYELYQRRRGYTFTESDKTAIIRKLVTGSMIIEGWTYDLNEHTVTPPQENVYG